MVKDGHARAELGSGASGCSGGVFGERSVACQVKVGMLCHVHKGWCSGGCGEEGGQCVGCV